MLLLILKKMVQKREELGFGVWELSGERKKDEDGVVRRRKVLNLHLSLFWYSNNTLLVFSEIGRAHV